MSFVAILFTLITIPQGGWVRNYGWSGLDIGESVRQTYDGGYIAGAISIESDADTAPVRFLLIKTKSNGDTIWTHIYDGGGTRDVDCCCVHQTKDGGYVIFGASASFGGIWLLRTDTNGDTIWTRILGKGGGLSVHQTDDEGFIITGYGPGSITISVVLIKTDSLGYVGVSEPVTPPVSANWQVVSPVGSTVTLRYSNQPQGFHVLVFDASGRKVDEIESQGESGTITWGQGIGPGVYSVRVESSHPSTKKIVLIR